MVNFGPLAAEIDPVFEAPLQISTAFASWQRYCTTSSSGLQPNFAALNRGHHLCSAGRPSRWAVAHVLVEVALQLILPACEWRMPFAADVYIKLECGPMANVMVALPNTGGARCSTLQSLAGAHYLTAVQ